MRPARLSLTTLVVVLALIGIAIGTAVVATSSSSPPNGRALRVHVGKMDEPDRGSRPPLDRTATDPRIFDLPHGNHVDAYWRPGRHHVPWIVYVHGGFWEYGDAYTASIRSWGRHELARGFAAFSIDYRLVPHVSWPTPVDDVEAADTWILAHASYFGLDLSRGFIVGHSAGGLLASVAALRTSDFAGAIDVAGAVDPLAEFESAPDVHLRSASLALLGDLLPLDDPKRWESARAFSYIGRHRFPFLIMQSRDDHTVPFASSAEFAAALEAHDYSVELLPLSGSDHELRSAADVRLQDTWIDRVLHRSVG